MLNCTTNSLVLRESKFENVHLFPGCGDDGCAVGSALYVAHNILNEPRYKYSDGEVCFLGPGRETETPDYDYLARKISEGQIVAWCNGRGEFGPRALGNRSMLADPRDYQSREKINFEIKDREWYRPLAPMVLEEHAKDWFDFPVKSPFMLFTAPIKRPEEIPAAGHIDNTARHQTVNEQDNPHCYNLIKAFYELTGVPVLMNTSLNESGEPLLETDEHAIEFFNRGLMDILVLNGKIIEKETP
jgi:carbamoyltransferase